MSKYIIVSLKWFGNIGIPLNARFKNFQSTFQCNIISWFGIIISLVLCVFQTFFDSWNSIALTSLFIGAGFVAPLVLNYAKNYLTARVFLSLYLPSVITLSSIVGKLTSVTLLADYETQYYDYRYFLLVSVCIITILYDCKKRWISNLLLIYIFLNIVLYDPILNSLGIGYYQTGHKDPTYYFTNVIVILCFFALVTVILFLRESIILTNENLEKEIIEVNRINSEIVKKEDKLKRYQQALGLFAKHNLENMPLNEIFNSACSVVKEALQTSRVNLWLMDSSQDFIQCFANIESGVNPFQTLHLKIFVNVHSHYFEHLRNNLAILAQDAQQNHMTISFKDNYLRPPDIQSLMDFPIMLHGSLVGVLCCEQSGGKRVWDTSDQFFVEATAKYVSLAIETHRRRETEIKIRVTAAELEKALSKAEESSRIKTIFLGSLSHEVRTPLQGILGFAEVLDSPGITDEKRKEYLNIIKRRATDMQSIIDSLLDMASADSGEIKPLPVKINLYKYAELTFHKLKQDYPMLKSIEFHMDNNLKSADTVFLDPQHLNQVLLNLYRNAVKFTNEGFIRFSYEKKGDQYVIAVTDSGIGIPPEKLDYIFEPFRQAHEGISRSRGGIGLGLAISKRLAELWGGEIQVESSPGKGSTFFVTIPVEQFFYPE